MTQLAEVALAFCRECLGWEAALWTGDGRVLIWDSRDGGDSLTYTDLNAIIETVEGYCSRNGLFVSCCRSPGLATWQAHIFCHGLDTSLGIDYPTLSEALLAACVEAARLMKQREQLAKG